MAYILGVDCSAYQGSDISGYLTDRDFCFVKITEGSHTVDSGWQGRISQARAAGVVVGAYHYAHPENAVDGDVSNFVNTYGPSIQPGDLIAVDMEMTGGLTADQVTQWGVQWIAAVREAFPSNLVGLYCNTNYWLNATTDRYGDFLWIAAYGTSDPGIQAAWTIWQYTDSPVDTNKALFASRADMRSWALSKNDGSDPSDPDSGDGGSSGDDGSTTAFPGAGYFGPGQSNDYVTQLGQMLIARGAAPFYQTGAGPTWTDVDGAAMAAFQTAQGWTGQDADGIPGAQSWELLTSGGGNDIADAGSMVPFPGGQWFVQAPNCWIVTAMGERLVAEGCSCYTSGPSAQWTSADECSYALWQERQGYSGSAADGIPGAASWNALQVPGA